MMAFKVAPELKRWLIAGADAAKRSLSQHTEMILAQARDSETLYGGPRTAAVLRALADEKSAFYGGDDSWLDDREACLAVFARWSDTLDGFVPSSPGPTDIMVEVGHQLMAALPAAEGELEQFLRQQLRQLAEMPGLDNATVDLFALTADPPDNRLSSLPPQPDAFAAPAAVSESSVTTARAAPEPEPGSIDLAKVAYSLWRAAEILLVEKLRRPVTPLEVAERLLARDPVVLHAIGLDARPNRAEDLLEYYEWLMSQSQATPPSRETDVEVIAAAASPEPPAAAKPRRHRQGPHPTELR
jgi:hypothetical protein